ncbi:MAG: hypothetical protein M3007_03965 [Candidatus Eremiobacteraeota bacterium]|nr:hypothetical protein [Candidatus Eremiobacteraeota bacterium]
MRLPLVSKSFALILIAISILFAMRQQAQAGGGCNNSPWGQTTLAVPGHPTQLVFTPDACHAFLGLDTSNPRSQTGIGVFERYNDTLKLVRVQPLESNPFGLSIVPGGRTLAVADDDYVVFVDVQRLLSNGGDPILGYTSDGDQPGTVDIKISLDGRFAFASDENINTITVIDLEKSRQSNFKNIVKVGQVPVEGAPTRLALSPDGSRLYVTSEIALAKFADPKACSEEGSRPNAPLTQPEGVLLTIDVLKAEHDPAHAVLARSLAGCSPVRVALSPDGRVAWVTVRHADELLAFDTAKLTADPAHARLAQVAVGKGPVGLGVIKNGALVVAGNADRFAPDQTTPRTITLVDAAKALAGQPAVVRTLTVGLFPREFTLSPDGFGLFLSNYSSDQITIFDTEKLP